MTDDKLDDSFKWDELREMVEEELQFNEAHERDKYLSQASKANTMVGGGSNGGFAIPAPQGHAMSPHMQPVAMQPRLQPLPQPGAQFPIQIPQLPVQMPQPPQPAVPAPGGAPKGGTYSNNHVPGRAQAQWVQSSRWSFDGKTAVPGAIADRLSRKPSSGSMHNESELDAVPPQAHTVQVPQQRPSNAGALDPRKLLGMPGGRQVEPVVIDVPRAAGAGNVGGIGMLFEKRSWEPYFRITGLLENGTAQAYGVRVDDFLLEVNGQPVARLTAKEVTGRILGLPGTVVRLRTAHPSAVLSPTAARQPAPGPAPPPAPLAGGQPFGRSRSSPGGHGVGASASPGPVFPPSQDVAALHFLAHAAAASADPGLVTPPSPLGVPAPSPALSPPQPVLPHSPPTPQPVPAPSHPTSSPGWGPGRARHTADLDRPVSVAHAMARGGGGADHMSQWRDKSGAAFSASAPHVQAMPLQARGAI